MKIKIPPALALWLIAPVFGELFSGSSPLNEYIHPVTFLTLGLLYGCGAIIVRELVVRWKKGWLAVLLLGMAYGIYEEGLLVQSFFDPTWMDLGELAHYGRLAGVNWVWAEHLTLFHALISISASIAFVEILYPEQRGEPWIKGRFWWIANWVGFIGIYLIWEAMTTFDPGIWKLLSMIAILILGISARLLPTRVLPPSYQTAPRPRRFFWIAFLGWLIQFLLVYSNVDKTPFIVPMLELLVLDSFILFLVLRWNGNGAAWDDRHRMALIHGALSFFLVFTALIAGKQYPVLVFTNPIFLICLWWAYRKVNKEQPRAVAHAIQPAEGQ
jgi:hypothetical protein